MLLLLLFFVLDTTHNSSNKWYELHIIYAAQVNGRKVLNLGCVIIWIEQQLRWVNYYVESFIKNINIREKKAGECDTKHGTCVFNCECASHQRLKGETKPAMIIPDAHSTHTSNTSRGKVWAFDLIFVNKLLGCCDGYNIEFKD